MAIMSDSGNRRTAGLGLVETDVNPEDRRQRFLKLTTKGNRLIADIRKDIGAKA